MGYYINPVGKTKEVWLQENGMQLPGIPPLPSTLPDTKRLLCYIDNGTFSALGVVFNDKEYEAFSGPYDKRRKVWVMVAKESLEDPSAGVDSGWDRIR